MLATWILIIFYSSGWHGGGVAVTTQEMIGKDACVIAATHINENIPDAKATCVQK